MQLMPLLVKVLVTVPVKVILLYFLDLFLWVKLYLSIQSLSRVLSSINIQMINENKDKWFFIYSCWQLRSADFLYIWSLFDSSWNISFVAKNNWKTDLRVRLYFSTSVKKCSVSVSLSAKHWILNCNESWSKI